MGTDTRLTAVPAARPARDARASAWLWVLGASSALIAAYPFLPEAGRIAVYHVIGLVAVVGILAGVRLQRIQRPLPWLLLAAGQLAFVLGDVPSTTS